jgi:hypothetical protein
VSAGVPPLTVRNTLRPGDPYPVFRTASGVAVPVHGWTYPPRDTTPIKAVRS